MPSEWHFLVTLVERLRAIRDPVEIQEVGVRLVGEHLQANRVNYALIEGEEYFIKQSYARAVQPFAGRGHVARFGKAIVDACRRGETVVVTDAHADPRFTDAERAELLANEIAAFVRVPVTKEGRWVATFAVQSATPRSWTPDQIVLLELAADRTWAAGERARAEEALVASAGGSWTWTAATNELEWDAQLRSLYGFRPDEPATPEAWVTRVHEDDRSRMLALREEMWTSKTKDSWESTYRIVRPDGAVAWIQSRGRVDRDADGNVERLIGLDLDFNEHNRTQEVLQARTNEEHDRELRLLLETATQGIVLVNADGVIVTANRALEAMFGWAPGELIGQSIEQLLPLSNRDVHARHRTAYFAAPRPRLMGGGLDLVGGRKDGSTFPIEVSLNHVATSGGGRAIAFVTDVTERRRAAAALHERTAALEYRTAQLSRLASDLTLAEHHAREQLAKMLHDGLQQLLLVAAVNLDQLLKRDAQLGIGSDELVVQARSGLDESIAAARSLSIELYPPVLQRSGLPAALTWLADQTRKKYGIDVQISADPLANSARKDIRTLLFESVRELLINAVKHAKADRVAIELALDPDDALRITVTDQGIGFDPAAVGDRAKTGPVGWGLFSIHERLTLLGGHFEIDSAPGKGTRMRLVAPRGHTQSSVTGPAASTFPPIGAASAGDNGRASLDALRILIVDDHVAVRGAFRDMLDKQPQLSVVGDASNGFEAIAQAHTLRPDIILMDISMPHMDGIEATTRIHDELPDIQIFGLSMQPRSVVADAIEQAGAVGFFAKDIDAQRLIEHLLVVYASRGAGNAAGRGVGLRE